MHTHTYCIYTYTVDYSTVLYCIVYTYTVDLNYTKKTVGPILNDGSDKKSRCYKNKTIKTNQINTLRIVKNKT